MAIWNNLKMEDLDATRKFLMSLDLSKKDIFDLPESLFSREEKQAYINALYGAWGNSWKDDLKRTVHSMQRWESILSAKAPWDPSGPTSHELLVNRAKILPPIEAGTSVSHFTDWLYRLYVPEKDYARLAVGRRLEREVALKRIAVPTHGRWKLIYNDLDEKDRASLTIPKLRIGGAPLKAKPDIVFKERSTGRILIIEIKVTDKRIWANGWPNLRAQMWAYSKIEQFETAPEILLVTEVWGLRPSLHRRQVLGWKGSDQTLEQQNSELFSIYEGHCTSLLGAT